MQDSSRKSVHVAVAAVAATAGLAGALVATPAAAESEIRPLTGFSSIKVSGGIDLKLRQGNEFRVEAVASSGSAEAIVTTVEDGTLEIHRSRTEGWFDWFTDYSVNVTLPELVAVAASGGSDVETEGAFGGERLTIAVSGGSDVIAELAVSELEAMSSGGSDLRLSGTADSVAIQASGGSDIDARDLRARAVDIQTSGGSDAVIDVSERLVAQASGGSDIVYSGNPATADIDEGGGAGVTRR